MSIFHCMKLRNGQKLNQKIPSCKMNRNHEFLDFWYLSVGTHQLKHSCLKVHWKSDQIKSKGWITRDFPEQEESP